MFYGSMVSSNDNDPDYTKSINILYMIWDVLYCVVCVK